MLGRIGGTALALGMIVAAPGALAQERIEPALEEQPEEPVATERQEKGGATGQQDAAPEQERAIDFLSGIQGIEAAIRDLIAEEDEIARQRQEDREISDLKAQQDMALWAMLMVFATFATVVVTAVGVFLIWKTLTYTAAAATHTKVAADAAVAMLDEAKQSKALLLLSRQLTLPWMRIKFRVPLCNCNTVRGSKSCEWNSLLPFVG